MFVLQKNNKNLFSKINFTYKQKNQKLIYFYIVNCAAVKVRIRLNFCAVINHIPTKQKNTALICSKRNAFVSWQIFNSIHNISTAKSRLSAHILIYELLRRNPLRAVYYSYCCKANYCKINYDYSYSFIFHFHFFLFCSGSVRQFPMNVKEESTKIYQITMQSAVKNLLEKN